MEIRCTAVLFILLMIVPAALLIEGVDLSEAKAEVPSRVPPDDYLYFTPYSYSDTGYPTYEEDFYIYIESRYNGEDYDDTDPAPGNYTAISEIRASFSGVYSEVMDLVNPPPIEWIRGTVDDNAGAGHTLDGYGWWKDLYFDSMGTNFLFRVKKDDIAPGIYFIRVMIEMKTMTGWDGVDKYDFKRTVEYEHIRFTVRSCLYPSDELGTPLISYDDNWNIGPLHSGSQFRMLGIRYLSSPYGDISEIRATLATSEAGIIIDEPVASLPDLSYQNEVIWRVTVAPNVLPGRHQFDVTFSYRFNGAMVNESPLSHFIMVPHSPLLLPPDTNDMTTPAAFLIQKDLGGNLTFTIRNAGNVELKDIRLRLDLQSSAYIKFQEFYYNEDSNAYKVQSQMIIEAGTLAVGASKEVTFQGIRLQQYLPPGKYMVPMDYECLYHDGGETGNPTGYKVAGYWDEKGIDTHTDIVYQRMYPRPENWELYPFIFVMVEDDGSGPDIQAYSNSNYISQTRGSTYRYLYFTVANYEYYAFDRITYTVRTDEGSPLLVPGSAENSTTTTFPPIYRTSLPAGSVGSYGSDNFQFYADIKEHAKAGTAYVPMDITGFDQYLQPFEKRVYVELLIQGRQPRFKVVSTSTSNVTDDMTVTVTAVVQNVGGGIAYDVYSQYFYNGNGYASQDDAVPVSSELKPGEKATMVFHFASLAPSLYIRGSYYGYLMFSYVDETGNFYDLTSLNEWFYFTVSAVLPNLYISDVRSGLLDWGKTTDVTVRVTNTGGTDAFDVVAYLPQNTNQFSVEDFEIVIGTIAPGQTVEFEFRVKAASEFVDGTTYTFPIIFKYRNVENRTLTFSEGETEYIYLRTKERIGDNQVQVIQEKGIDEGTGILFMGIFVLIGILVFTWVYARARRPSLAANARKGKDEGPKVRSWEE